MEVTVAFVQSLLTRNSFRSRPIETENRMNENGLFVIDADNSQRTVSCDRRTGVPTNAQRTWVCMGGDGVGGRCALKS